MRRGDARLGRGWKLPLWGLLLIPSLVMAQGEFNIQEKCDNDFRVAMEYFRSRQVPDAHELFTTVVEACPEYVEAYFYKGRCENDMKQYAEAIRTFRDGLDVDPGHVGIRENLAFALIQNQQVEDGVGVYEDLIREFPDRLEYWLRYGYACGEVGRTADAVMAAEQAVELRADSLGLWKNFDYFLAKNKLIVPSLQTGEKIRLREPGNVQMLSRLGAGYADAKRYERAIPIYEEIYACVFPENGAEATCEFTKRRANDLWKYANVLKGVKDFDRAADVFDKVLQTEWYQDNAPAWVQLSFIYKDAKRFDEGVQAAQRGLELDGANCSAMCALGKNLEGKGLAAEKSRDFEGAVKFITDAKSYFSLASTTCPTGRWHDYGSGEAARMDEHLKRLRQKKSMAEGK